jgi:hypothetical protein
MIVNARGRNIRMPQPFLDLGDIGLMIKRVRRRSRPQRVRADLKAERRRIPSHHLVHRIRRDCLASGGTAIAMHRSKQRAGLIRATGITEYLKNGGKLEIAQQLANHESSRTTDLCDRRDDQASLDEIERIMI